MGSSKLLIIFLTVALGISVCAVAYIGSQNVSLTNENSVLSDENEVLATRLEMVSLLSQVQVQVEMELQQLGTSLVYASEQLTSIGISGDQARALMSALAANSSFTIEAATQNLNRTMITVEPAEYHVSEGKTIGPQKWLNVNPNGPIIPSMTPVLRLITGDNGVSIVVPVFNVNKTQIGTVSIAFDHVALLNATIMPLIKDTVYTVTVMQTNSTDIFDSDATQIGKDLTDSMYAGYPELLSLIQRAAIESSGYGTYAFTLNDGSGQVVQKECYWTTINAYGAQWRIALQHSLNA